MRCVLHGGAEDDPDDTPGLVHADWLEEQGWPSQATVEGE